MCGTDAAAKEAAVVRFLHEHPEPARAASDHPALRGSPDADWPRAPGHPAIPALLHALLDATAAPAALPVLENLLMDGTFRLSPAMPKALPFLLGLASVPDLPVRRDLIGLLIVAAELSAPVDPADEARSLLLGIDADHPERAACRTVFRAHARAVRALLTDETIPDGLLGADDRACLLAVAGPRGHFS
ncbi:hypothetical protein [Streptomyces sp. NPDC090025]|uniref:hypothetical protein n=1 Tax=Streptomyces sp. NPDC090025 TaxID=3365922 RepID=UPI00383244E5